MCAVAYDLCVARDRLLIRRHVARNCLLVYSYVVQLVECHFDSWDSDDLKFGMDGLDKTCRSLVWASISSLYPSLLEIPIDLATVRP